MTVSDRHFAGASQGIDVQKGSEICDKPKITKSSSPHPLSVPIGRKIGLLKNPCLRTLILLELSRYVIHLEELENLPI